MRYVLIGLALVSSASAARAATTCTYTSSYNDPGFFGPCFLDAAEGCPVHVLVPRSTPPLDLTPQVTRNGVDVPVTVTTDIAGTTPADLPTIDYYSCDCHRDVAHLVFDQVSLTLSGAREGDDVRVAGGRVTIGPATACQPPDWSVQFDVQLGGCDLCPVDPVPDDHGGGCSTGASGGWAAALLALLAIRRGLGHANRSANAL